MFTASFLRSAFSCKKKQKMEFKSNKMLPYRFVDLERYTHTTPNKVYNQGHYITLKAHRK